MRRLSRRRSRVGLLGAGGRSQRIIARPEGKDGSAPLWVALPSVTRNLLRNADLKLGPTEAVWSAMMVDAR